MKISPVDIGKIIDENPKDWVLKSIIIIANRVDELIKLHNEQDELEDTYFD